jgi:prepilin-type processing-associated H-X9-DG protein/prepilin-type N-terminal cleavage/methylation domain-containing protein
MTHRRSRAFTLVELLVVIGIIALLIAILLPSLTKARKQALAVACASNLRQLGQAMVLYTNEYKYYPASQAVEGGRFIGVWPTRLRKAMGLPQSTGNNVFWCPAQEPTFQWKMRPPGTGANYANVQQTGFGYEEGEALLFVDTTPFSYGYNDWGSMTSYNGQGQGRIPVDNQVGLGGDINPGVNGQREMKAGRVRRAAEMIAIADNTPDFDFDMNIDPWNSHEYPGNIHYKGCNVLFVDGHVAWYLQKELIKPFDTASRYPMLRMWNADGRVHLEGGVVIE